LQGIVAGANIEAMETAGNGDSKATRKERKTSGGGNTLGRGLQEKNGRKHPIISWMGRKQRECKPARHENEGAPATSKGKSRGTEDHKGKEKA